MAHHDNQVLPNDQTVQIDFRANPRMLDHRGEWAAKLSERLGLSEWAIVENRIDVFDKPKTEHAIVTFKSAVNTYLDLPSRDDLPTRAAKFLTAVSSLPSFGDPISVNRIGVRSRFCTEYNGSFEQLMKKYCDRYLELKPAALAAIHSYSGEATMADIGAPLNFKDQYGEFHTHCGPMERRQMKAQYFQFREEAQLPAVGLYYDIDYFVLPKAEMAHEEVITKVVTFAHEAWDRHQRVRKLIVGA